MASKNGPKQHFVFSSAEEVLTLPGIDYLQVRPEVRDHPNNKPSNHCSYPFPSRDVGRKDWAVRSGDSRVNVRGTTRLTSAAIDEVLNRVCDVVIWLMRANGTFYHTN
jgi:hypothetical protein